MAAAASADAGSTSSASSTAQATTLTLATTPNGTATIGGSSGTPAQKTLQINIAQMTQALLSAGTGVVQATGGEAVSTTGGGGGTGATGGASAGTGGGGVNGVTPNINQLLPSELIGECFLSGKMGQEKIDYYYSHWVR